MIAVRHLLLAAALLAFGTAPAAAAGLFQPVAHEAIDEATARATGEPLDQLVKDVEHLHPVAMMLLAKRLNDAGRNEEALFWFYESQLRWRGRLGSDPFEDDAFERLFSDVGPDINHFAQRHIDLWLKVLDDVLAWDAKHPDDFAGAKRDTSRDGLVQFRAYIVAHRAEIEQKAAEEDREAGTPTADDPYPGSGGALFGTPQEMIGAYDPHAFDGFKIGTTKKAEVVKALGKPEIWSTEPDGTSSLSYSYHMADGASAVLGMVRRVSVSFTFDANKVLTGIALPSDKAP